LPAWLFTGSTALLATAARDDKVGVLVLKRPRLEDGDAARRAALGYWSGPARAGDICAPTTGRPGRKVSRQFDV